MTEPVTWPPNADFAVLSSRVAPDLDGGYAIAVLRRLKLLEAAGVVRPLLLTVDGASPEVHARQRRSIVRRGLIAPSDRMRNLMDETVDDPSWLIDVAAPGEATPGIPYRTVSNDTGEPILSLPVLADDPEWHLTKANIVVHGPGGDRVVPGFGALYVAWLAHIADGLRRAAGDSDRLFVVICEARQIGELLVTWDDPRVRIVHTVHNSHLPPPYVDPTAAPLDGLWKRWLAKLDRFDAVLWPTASQRDDVIARFGEHEGFAVVPTPVELGPEPVPSAARDPRLVVMASRLVAQKRVDLALRAWGRVVETVPDARLDVFGDGPLREVLQAMIDELGLNGSVRLREPVEGTNEIFDRSAILLSSSAFEGQNLAIAEALARGLPVVSFDARYGPRDIVGDGGVLVPPEDVDALADAVIALLSDEARRREISAGARNAALPLSPQSVRAALVAALADAIERPSRRASCTSTHSRRPAT